MVNSVVDQQEPMFGEQLGSLFDIEKDERNRWFSERVFPTYVGMNRTGEASGLAATVFVFPKYLGMTRFGFLTQDCKIRVPHMCGDEPSISRRITCFIKCSPIIWG